MNLAKSISSFAFLAISSTSLAQTGNYFPLNTGNVWLYRLGSTRSDATFRTISVEGQEKLNGTDYFRVRYFERVVYLRSNPDGSIVSLNRESGSEEPWLKLNESVGATFESHIDPCTDTGRIAERGVEVVSPAGRFVDTVQVTFQGHCADAGPTRQHYAAGVGLVVHEETSFAGPRRFELVYFRTSAASGGGTEISFTIGLDAPTYQAGSNLSVRLTLRSTHPDPVKLSFSSGQAYDLKIYNEAGVPVYMWSSGKSFISIIRDEQFGPGEKSYEVLVPLGTLPPGRYKAQGYLTTSPVTYLGEAAFEIVAASR